MSCSKRAYPDRTIGEREAARFTRLNGYRMRAYRCDRCPYWHLTGDRQKVLHWHLGTGEIWADGKGGRYTCRNRPDGKCVLERPDGEVSEPLPSEQAARRLAEALATMDPGKWDDSPQIRAMMSAEVVL